MKLSLYFFAMAVGTIKAFTPLLANQRTSSVTSLQASSSSSSSRRDFMDGTAAAVVSLATTGIVGLHPGAANAADAAVPVPNFVGVYSDLCHLKGYRVIREVNGGKDVFVELQDEPNGKVMQLSANPQTDKKKREFSLAIDFSPLGGPKINGLIKKDGKVTFADGNTWTKVMGIQGVYNDPQHPQGYRVVRFTGKNGQALVELQDDDSSDVLNCAATVKQGTSSIAIDFTSKGGPSSVIAQFKNNKLIFPDGNAWTKL